LNNECTPAERFHRRFGLGRLLARSVVDKGDVGARSRERFGNDRADAFSAGDECDF
jgi:hypothetical protein